MDIITSENCLDVPHKLSKFDCPKSYFTQSSLNKLNFQEVPTLFFLNNWKLSFALLKLSFKKKFPTSYSFIFTIGLYKNCKLPVQL